ncbi:hypothetical protein [Streptomyces sp. NPDC058855]|uniref:DUF7848 domain-containing protein n=1 Tax=Streptomyces sp. NPDC058855 TaxID=3346651 RepID=UPI00367D38A4
MTNTARVRYRFAQWTLRAITPMSVRHGGLCMWCGERSNDTTDPDTAQLWCLKHAGLTGHTDYELSAFQYFNATMTGPTGGTHGT